MKCKHVQLLLSRYIDGDLRMSKKEAIRVHLADCPRCREAYENLQKTVDMLHALSLPPVPEKLADTVLAVLQKEEKQNAGFMPRLFRSRQLYSAAAAFVLLIVLLHSGVPKRYDKTETEQIPQSAVSVQNTAAPDEAKAGADNEIPSEDYEKAAETAEARAEDGIKPTSSGKTASKAAPAETTVPVLSDRESERRDTAESGETNAAPGETAAPALSVPQSVQSKAAGTFAPSLQTSPAPEGQDVAPETAGEVTDAENEALADTFAAMETAQTPMRVSMAETEVNGGVMRGIGASKATGVYTEKTEMQKRRVTFYVTDKSAQAVFDAAAAGGADAVRKAFADAGIPYSEQEFVIEDYTARYNTLVQEANTLSARLAEGGEKDVQAQLAGKKAEMDTIQKECAAVKAALVYTE